MSKTRNTAFWVDDAVNWLRNRGFRRCDAIQQAADRLGISAWKVRSILSDEAFSISAAEYERIEQRFTELMLEQIEYHEKQAAKLRERLEKLKAEGVDICLVSQKGQTRRVLVSPTETL